MSRLSPAGSQAWLTGMAHRQALTGRATGRAHRHGSPAVTNTGPWGFGASLGSAVLAQVVFFIASHTTFLSSFFRFDVLVTICLYDSL